MGTIQLSFFTEIPVVCFVNEVIMNGIVTWNTQPDPYNEAPEHYCWRRRIGGFVYADISMILPSRSQASKIEIKIR